MDPSLCGGSFLVFSGQVNQTYANIVCIERCNMMKYIRIFALALFLVPYAARGASNDFMVAAQLLAAARNADIGQVQVLVNNGADVNFVDSTGLSVVCTALMNNDVRAAQILQMYGADASKCDQQIKKYNSKNKTKERSGGLFSGLSSAHTLTLAAAGAAVVVGGLLLFTDVFDSGNGNSSGGGSGDRPNNGGDNGGNSGTATAKITLPYGPAMPNAESESANYSSNLNYYSPSIDGTLKDTFELMAKSGQNYLLMMHGYSPLARGYLGMRTLRGTGNVPVDATTLGKINVKGITVGGGRPAGVALVTANGVNAAAKPVGTETAQKNSLDDELLAWTTISGNVVNEKPEISNLSSKYYNNLIVLGGDGAEVTNSYTVEDKAFIADFDLSGQGTAINNSNASAADDMLAKVVGGANSGYSVADYIGFMPNGQMGIFRTGDGRGMKAVTDASPSGEYTMAGTTLAVGDKITLFGKEMTVSSVSGTTFEAQDTGIGTYKGYIGANGQLYINSTLGGEIDQTYSMADGKLTLVGQLGDIDYYNYKALLKSGVMWAAGDLAGGRSRMDVIANASVIEPLHSRTTKTIDDMIANLSPENFAVYVNSYYDRDTTDGPGGTNALPATDAISFFNGLGTTFSPLVIFSTGASQTDSAWSDAAQVATFENAAPLVFSNLEHLFMSVVAIGMTGTGTSGATTVAGYTPANKFAIAQWTDTNNTDVTTDDKYYKARVCGIAGKGANGIDPWCFAATGVTDELAVSSAAGAAGAVKSAFSYLNNKELFTLLALTADGPYLGTTTDGSALTKDSLRAYLQNLYQMPAEYQYRWEKGGEEYLDVFKEVFGYGLINLERATKPATSIYYYDATSGKIVSGSGNAYWRAASKTNFRASSAFSPRVASIGAPFFDVLESADGELRMPRIWENEFAVGAGRRRGLYLNDVFGDLKTRDAAGTDVQIGGLRFSMSASDRPYADNMGGLDSMRLGMSRGNWDISAQYQHNFTDGAGLFSGMANPIMSLAHDAVLSDAWYSAGRWSFGVRAFSGAITDNELLENDPTISAQYTPARLGLMHGGAFGAGWRGARFGLNADIGIARETETVLGAQTGGLLSLGGGDTSYVDVHGRYGLSDTVSVSARATFARTTADAAGQYVMGISDIYSNAFAVGLNLGNFEFTLSQPLAARGGHLKYAYAEYDTVETDDGRFDIVVGDTGVRSAALRPARRENRLAMTYRHSFGEFTDGAVGFIYRMNPNNTDEFGDESVFMLKLSHRLGI